MNKNLIIYSIEKVLITLISVLTIKLYVNIFSQSDYGVYSIVSSMMNLANSILFFVFAQSIVRFAYKVKKENEDLKFYNTIFFSYLTLFLIYIPIHIIIFNKYSFLLLILVLVQIFLDGFISFILSYLRAFKKSFLFSIIELMIALGKLVIVYFLATNYNLGIEVVFMSIIPINIIILISLMGYYKLYKYLNIKTVDKKYLKNIYVYGLPLMINTIVTWVIALSDRLLINLYYTEIEVAQYAFNYDIGNKVFGLINTVLILTVYPIIIHLWEEKKERLKEGIETIIDIYALVAIPSIAGIYLIINDIVVLLGNENYINGGIIILYVSISMFLFGISIIFHKIFELYIKTYYILISNIFVAIINLVLNLILLPHFNFIVAGITTLISYLLYFLLIYLNSKKILKIKIHFFNLLIYSVYSIMMIFLISSLNINLNPIFNIIIKIVLGISIYLILLIITRQLSKTKLKQISYNLGENDE